MRKYFQELIGTVIGGVTGWIGSGLYEDWIRPIVLSAICAFVCFVVTHCCKMYVDRRKRRKENRVKSNGHS